MVLTEKTLMITAGISAGISGKGQA